MIKPSEGNANFKRETDVFGFVNFQRIKNPFKNQIASRAVAIEPGSRCLCVWKCRCHCVGKLETHVDFNLCQVMPEIDQKRAGFTHSYLSSMEYEGPDTESGFIGTLKRFIRKIFYITLTGLLLGMKIVSKNLLHNLNFNFFSQKELLKPQ